MKINNQSIENKLEENKQYNNINNLQQRSRVILVHRTTQYYIFTMRRLSSHNTLSVPLNTIILAMASSC